jgi:hypothetical protein
MDSPWMEENPGLALHEVADRLERLLHDAVPSPDALWPIVERLRALAATAPG